METLAFAEGVLGLPSYDQVSKSRCVSGCVQSSFAGKRIAHQADPFTPDQLSTLEHVVCDETFDSMDRVSAGSLGFALDQRVVVRLERLAGILVPL